MGDLTPLVQQEKSHSSLEHEKALKAFPLLVAEMAMGAHIGSWLEHVDEPLNKVVRLMQVVIHAQPAPLASLFRYPIEQILIQALQRLVLGHSISLRLPLRYAAGTSTRNRVHQAATATPRGSVIQMRCGHHQDPATTAKPVRRMLQG
jgi:hypothetical protein